MLSHLLQGFNNLRVIDLTMLHSSRLSLTIVEIDPLLEGLSRLSVKMGVRHLDMVSEFIRLVTPR